MSLVEINGRMMKQHFIGTPYGPSEGWIDCGPAEPHTRFDRALCAMSYFEKRDRTESRLYKAVQSIANSAL